MNPPPDVKARAVPWGWWALVLATAATYLVGLDSAYAPTNGDEMVYIHIARLTAQSGHWLPLVSDLANMRNTKPPLLFWQAMAAGDWGQQWSLWALRLPSVVYTFLTTALISAVTLRLSGRMRTACLAAALYLLYFSTFRYGRVYLTSAPETFWFSLPLFWLLWWHARRESDPRGAVPSVGWGASTVAGLTMGVGLVYKSFALVAPAAATLLCATLMAAPTLRWRSTLRITVTVAWSATIALGIFALWFALDPDPGAVWREFVIGENAGKLAGEHGYWHAAFLGDYPVWKQLLAYPENAGLLVLPVLGWAVAGLPLVFRRSTYAGLAPTNRILLVWLAVWLLVFCIPSQRSARYVIPAMPALAMLMALAWEKIGLTWFRLTLLVLMPALLMLGRVGWVMGDMQMASGAQVASVLIAAGVGTTLGMAGLFLKKWARGATLGVCLAVYAAFGCMVAPLGTPQAGYSAAVQSRLQGQRVAVPNGFTGQYERFHFLLPASELVPYDAEGRITGALRPDLVPPERLRFLLDQFDAVVWLQDELDQPSPSCLPECVVLATRWHVKSRHHSGEVTLGNLWYPQQWLFRHEWLVAKVVSSPGP